MFRLKKASRSEATELLATARDAALSSPDLLTLAGGLVEPLPMGFVHDFSRSELGRGLQIFAAAREAFQRWEQFDLGWVEVIDLDSKIAAGEVVAVQAHTACLWSINCSRVVAIVDSPTRFGFMYTTTALHIEEGQERFVLQFDPENESVSYLLEAVSRPRHLLARMGYPISRAMQHRFARDSHARMGRSVLPESQNRFPLA